MIPNAGYDIEEAPAVLYSLKVEFLGSCSPLALSKPACDARDSIFFVKMVQLNIDCRSL